MDPYLIFVVILFALAITDLVVGVSNDAVNFLNSAIGSRVANKRTIMIVASLGIFVGATFSAGMMEVARKGIFDPSQFFFAEIMVIFLAVMITDIILLDLFNTLGLPTSTTVSIVFELLGAAVALTLLKISQSADGVGELFSEKYINWDKAGLIIAGIFLAVFVAFVVGLIVQYISRLLLSFQYNQRLRWVGGLWAGFAFTSLTFFLIIKGMKGASFISDDVLDWVKNNTLLLVGISFVFWTVVMQALHAMKVNILRLVVLFGTFALAMAFAGNDLVNFIGVPIAGLESFTAWTASGTPADAFPMESLAAKVKTPTFLLLGAGAVMILTLWFSRKARSVTATTVDLSRQEEGQERFKSNMLARGLVRFGIGTSKVVNTLVPPAMQQRISLNFQQPAYQAAAGEPADPPAFDLVRASVNLVVASMLIAYGTSQKLPLSTTYVSFMVVMGASLADRAWGRESAVYRISGVINVIAGWLMTAAIAFTVSAVFAVIIYYGGMYAVLPLVAFAAILIIRSSILVKRKQQREDKEAEFHSKAESLDTSKVVSETRAKVATSLKGIDQALSDAINGLLTEDRSMLKRAKGDQLALKQENEHLRYRLFTYMKRLEDPSNGGSKVYLAVYDLEQDILQSSWLIVDSCVAHINNVHGPLVDKQAEFLRVARAEVSDYLKSVREYLNAPEQSMDQLLAKKTALLKLLEDGMAHQVAGIRNDQYGSRNSMLFFSLLLESKDLVAVAGRFAKLYHRIAVEPSGKVPDSVEL